MLPTSYGNPYIVSTIPRRRLIARQGLDSINPHTALINSGQVLSKMTQIICLWWWHCHQPSSKTVARAATIDRSSTPSCLKRGQRTRCDHHYVTIHTYVCMSDFRKSMLDMNHGKNIWLVRHKIMCMKFSEWHTVQKHTMNCKSNGMAPNHWWNKK